VILDQLKHAAAYRNLGDNFAAGIDYLLHSDFAHIPDGRYEVIGSHNFAIVQSYTTKPPEKGRWEAHRKYADIQYMLNGGEKMGVAPLERMNVEQAYDGERDLEFFTLDDARGTAQVVAVEQGSFAIFLPHDVHMPTLMIDRPAGVRKVVVKVRLE
jgi:YhcH/YjgK/YiaL family protein